VKGRENDLRIFPGRRLPPRRRSATDQLQQARTEFTVGLADRGEAHPKHFFYSDVVKGVAGFYFTPVV
jgi:hypothetical protein